MEGDSVYGRHARSACRRRLLGAGDRLPLHDTAVVLQVESSWAQGGRGSLPGDDVVLVTACPETVSGVAPWITFLTPTFREFCLAWKA